MMRLRQIFMLLILAVTAPSVAFAEDTFAIDGSTITVTTERFRVIFDTMRLIEIENLMTGEIYASPQPDTENTPGYEAFRNRFGVSIMRLYDSIEHMASINAAAEAVGEDAFRDVGESAVTTAERKQQKKKVEPDIILAPGAATKIESVRIPNGLRVTYTGLYAGKEAEPAMALTVDFVIDPASGDLCLTPNVKGNINPVNGVRDRGVQQTMLQMCNLAGEMNMVLPIDNGAHFNRKNGGDERVSKKLFRMPWPGSWQAAIFIAEGERGCLALWADEPEMKYSRALSLTFSDNRWYTGFEFGTRDVPWECDDITGATWRFNVFKGYWARAAEHYRKQCEKQWPEMRPLEMRKPAWAAKSRVMVLEPWPTRAGKVMRKLPPGSHVVDFQPQCWLLGWDDMTTKKIYGEMDGIFPNGPDQMNPVRYEARAGFTAEIVGAAEKLGMHVFPYTNAVVMNWNHPWKMEKLGGRTDCSWRLWQRMYAELMDDVIKRYGSSGIYQDCSWVGYGSPLLYGTPDGLTGENGFALMQSYFRKLQPEVATMGERRQENTARVQEFALQVSGWGVQQAHPIMGSLQEPYCRSYNFFSGPGNMDIDDIQGMLMSYWRENVYLLDNPLHEDKMNLRRGQIFTQEQLLNYFPDVWDKDVLHYFKNSQGEEFRIIRKDGVRLVKKTEAGDKTYYIRLRGVQSADSAGGGIDGWLAYDVNDRIIGLNPDITYCVFDDVNRPETIITSLPDNFVLKRSILRDGFWLAELTPFPARKTPPDKQSEPPAPPQELTVRVRSTNPQVKFTGVRAVKKLSDVDYELTVLCPGGFGAYWIEPVEPLMNQGLGEIPAINTIQRKTSGLTYRMDRSYKGSYIPQDPGDCKLREEGSLLWLLKIPVETTWFVTKCGAGDKFGDGAIYKVRVNGREIWSLHCPSVIGADKEGKGIPALKQRIGAVDLRAYQDQVVIFEMAIDGGYSNISERTLWTYPHLVDTDAAPAGAYESAAPGKKSKKARINMEVELDLDE